MFRLISMPQGIRALRCLARRYMLLLLMSYADVVYC